MVMLKGKVRSLLSQGGEPYYEGYKWGEQRKPLESLSTKEIVILHYMKSDMSSCVQNVMPI